MTSRWVINSLRKFYCRSLWNSRPSANQQFSHFTPKIPTDSISAKYPVGLLLASVSMTLKEMYRGEPQMEKNEAKIRDLMKSAEESFSHKRFSDAEVQLEEALRLANEERDEKAVDCLMERLATVFFESNQFEKAEKVLSQLIAMLIDQKTDPTGPDVVELSLKLAEAYWKLGDLQRAEDGYKFCVTSQRKNVTKVMDGYSRKAGKIFVTMQDSYQEENQALALYGMVSESFSRYLMMRNKFKEAEFYFAESLQVAFRVYGPSHKHTVAMQNNFGCLCLKQKQYETAAYFLEQATVKALYNPDCTENLPAYYSNYAEALFQVGRYDEALEKARKSVVFARKVKDSTVLSKAEKFLSLLETDVNTRQKSQKKT